MTVHRGKGIYESSTAQTDRIWSLEEKNKFLFVEEKIYFSVALVVKAFPMFFKWILTINEQFLFAASHSG